eukprot:3018045-Rhodomonas_salina.1
MVYSITVPRPSGRGASHPITPQTVSDCRTASSHSSTFTAVTLELYWFSPGRAQGFNLPAPFLTMVCSSSQRAVTVSRDRTGAVASRAPCARSGSSAPGHHPLVSCLHSFSQPLIPLCYRPRLDTCNKQLSCISCHKLSPPSCARAQRGPCRRVPHPRVWPVPDELQLRLWMSLLPECPVWPGGGLFLCLSGLLPRLHQAHCDRIRRSGVPAQYSVEFCLCPLTPCLQSCREYWGAVQLPDALAPASRQGQWQRIHLDCSAFSSQRYLLPPPSQPRVSPSRAHCLQGKRSTWPPGTRCAGVWPPSGGCPDTCRICTAWEGLPLPVGPPHTSPDPCSGQRRDLLGLSSGGRCRCQGASAPVPRPIMIRPARPLPPGGVVAVLQAKIGHLLSMKSRVDQHGTGRWSDESGCGNLIRLNPCQWGAAPESPGSKSKTVSLASGSRTI